MNTTTKIDYKNFSLVLSGGGALGIAHLGVIHTLESKNIIPKEIVGTSMGGIIGACLAIGMSSADISTLIQQFSNMLKWIRFSFGGNAIINIRKIEQIFIDIFGSKQMSDTDIPLKLITTDFATGDIKVFNEYDDVLIKDALLATMAIPGVFEEKKIGDKVFVDGFLCANLGISETSYNDILAVDVLGYNSFAKSLPSSSMKSKNILSMFEKSMRFLIYNQTKAILNQNSDKNILLLSPNTKNFKTFQFNKYKALKEVGQSIVIP